jgi:hypothetical protein
VLNKDIKRVLNYQCGFMNSKGEIKLLQVSAHVLQILLVGAATTLNPTDLRLFRVTSCRIRMYHRASLSATQNLIGFL